MTRSGARLLIAAGVVVGFARAAHGDPACILEAKATALACIAQCRDDLRSARFACRGVDASCGRACLAGRQVCTDAAEDILQTGQVPGGGVLANCSGGTAGCRAALQAAKAICGAPCNGNAVCDACVDAAQVTAFVCRDGCRESWRTDPTVKSLLASCRTTFRACVAACPKS